MIQSKKIAILGAGLSGITQALNLQEEGNEVIVFDQNPEVGGVLQSKRMNGYLLDCGANTLSLRSQKKKAFLEKHHILEHALDANPTSTKRFIVRNSKLVTLPQNFLSFLKSPFLSPLGKMRLLVEPFIPRKTMNIDSESMGAFVKRRLGSEVLNYAANPFIGGIYASRPESLILKHAFPQLCELEKQYGSLFWGLIKSKKNKDKLPQSRLISFSEGMQELPQRLSLNLSSSLRLGHEVTEIRRANSNEWSIVSQKEGNEVKVDYFDEIICTLPSHRLASIEWKDLHREDLLNILAKASHPPLAMTFLGIQKECIAHPLDGFGFLVPEVEKRKILGTLFSSTLFPNRAPKGKALLTTFIGGERNAELCKLSDKEIIDLSFEENKSLLGISGSPEFKEIIRWPHSIPLPDLTTTERLKASALLSDKNPGLHFSGSHLSGAPLPNCIHSP